MTNSMIVHHYDEQAKEGKWEVFVSPRTSYGYYEHDDMGEGGGLWFERDMLVDYDGRVELPRNVILALHRLGKTFDQFILPDGFTLPE